MYNVYHTFRDLRQFLLIVTLTPEVLPSNLQLYTSSFLLTCRFYKVFGGYLLCCVRIGLDWIHILGHQLDWTGLGSVARGFGLDWIVSTRSIPCSARYTASSRAAESTKFQRLRLRLRLRLGKIDSDSNSDSNSDSDPHQSLFQMLKGNVLKQ